MAVKKTLKKKKILPIFGQVNKGDQIKNVEQISGNVNEGDEIKTISTYFNPFVTSPGDLRGSGRPFRYEPRRSPGLIA